MESQGAQGHNSLYAASRRQTDLMTLDAFFISDNLRRCECVRFDRRRLSLAVVREWRVWNFSLEQRDAHLVVHALQQQRAVVGDHAATLGRHQGAAQRLHRILRRLEQGAVQHAR